MYDLPAPIGIHVCARPTLGQYLAKGEEESYKSVPFFFLFFSLITHTHQSPSGYGHVKHGLPRQLGSNTHTWLGPKATSDHAEPPWVRVRVMVSARSLRDPHAPFSPRAYSSRVQDSLPIQDQDHPARPACHGHKREGGKRRVECEERGEG